MFEYYPYEPATFENFEKACKCIERAFPKAVREGPFMDVDGDLVASYKTNGGEIVIINDSDFLNEVYVNSEVELSDIFQD